MATPEQVAAAEHALRALEPDEGNWPTGEQVETIIDAATPLRGYLDLRTSMLPENEWSGITGAPPRVIAHEYGAWVHVPPAGSDVDPLDEEWDIDPLDDEDWTDFPHLNAVLREARRLGADWVNFDQDGHDELPGLPTFDW